MVAKMMSDSPDLTTLTADILDFISNTKPGELERKYSFLEGQPRTIAAKSPDGRWGAGCTAFEERRPDVHLHIALVLDISGSMMEMADGSDEAKLDVALQCIERICRSPFLADDDWLNVIVFTDHAQDVFESPLKTFDYKQFKATVDQAHKGLTAARDGVVQALRNLTKARVSQVAAAGKREVISYILAFTDGADNVSKTSVARPSRKMRDHGLDSLYFNFIATGLDDDDRDTWAGICGEPGCRLEEIKKASELNIRLAFCKALEHIRHLVLVDTLTQNMEIRHYAGDVEQADKVDEEVSALIVEVLKGRAPWAHNVRRTATLLRR